MPVDHRPAAHTGVSPAGVGDLLLPAAVFVRSRWQGRRHVLQELSEALARALGLDPRLVLEGVLERERLGSTGVGEGVAIPHARIAGLDRVAGGLVCLAEGIDFESIDGRPVDLIFMLLAPEDAGSEHLRALARVSRLFRQEAIRNRLRGAPTREAALQALSPEADGVAAA